MTSMTSMPLLLAAIRLARKVEELDASVTYDRGSPGDEMPLAHILEPVAEAAGVSLDELLRLAEEQKAEDLRLGRLNTLARLLRPWLAGGLNLDEGVIHSAVDGGEVVVWLPFAMHTTVYLLTEKWDEKPASTSVAQIAYLGPDGVDSTGYRYRFAWK